MEDNYSIDEILSAVNDLQKINKDKSKKTSKEPSIKFYNSNKSNIVQAICTIKKE